MQQATIHNDPEAVALAACYRLLIQKARERRARLAMQAEKEGDAAAIVEPTQQDEGVVIQPTKKGATRAN